MSKGRCVQRSKEDINAGSQPMKIVVVGLRAHTLGHYSKEILGFSYPFFNLMQ